MDIIGLHEKITLTKAGIVDLETKTDTGAYNSAIDCSFAEESIDEKGVKILRYILLNENHPLYTGKVRRTKTYKKKVVRSSNGIETPRYQVQLKLKLKGEEYKTRFNLSDRSKMRYAVLLGRKFIAKRFLVDVSLHRKLKKVDV